MQWPAVNITSVLIIQPVDILEGIALAVEQLARGEARLEIQYRRAVRPEGNPAARALRRERFEGRDPLRDRHRRVDRVRRPVRLGLCQRRPFGVGQRRRVRRWRRGRRGHQVPYP